MRSLFSMMALVIGCDSVDTPALAPAPTVHTFTSAADGFDTHTYWIDTGEEVVVFDAQFTPALAAEMLGEITAATDSPVRYLVITHPNPDKFNGASVFQDAGAQVVASEATAAAMPGVHAYKEAYFVGVGMFTPETYPSLPTVDVTFSEAMVLGTAVPVSLSVLDSPGVAATQTVAQVGDAVFVGDLVAGRAHAWLEGAIVDGGPRPDISGWVSALGELAELAPGTTVYPGRGAALPVADAVAEQQDYLQDADEVVSSYVGSLSDPAAALGGAEAGDHYAAITAEMEAAYPEHALSYLVTYGVYGLALQHAAE